MTKKELKMNIQLAKNYANEIKECATSLVEDIDEASSMTEAWGKINTFYRTIESFRNRQKCTGSKSFSILTDAVDGHTKYLQGLDIPIMVNSILNENGEWIPSEVCEMHIGMVDGKTVLIITPTEISL